MDLEPSQRDSDEPPRRVAELDVALDRGEASFGDLFQAHFGRHSWRTKEPELRAAYEWYYPRIIKAFEAKHGALEDLFYCSHVCAGVVLTSDNDIYVSYDPGQFQEAEQLLYRGHLIAVEANEFLEEAEEKRILQAVFDVTNAVLAIMDREAATSPGRDSTFTQEPRLFDALRQELDDIEALLNRMTQRRAQSAYFWGMTRGLVLPAMAALLFGLFLNWVDQEFDAGPILGAVLAGSVGAWISVIARSTSGRFKLDHRAGSEQLGRLGLFRPIVGAVFALALFFVIEGAILPIDVQHDGLTKLFFFTALGFLAGFQERWAQDMLSLAGRNYVPDRSKSDGAS